MTELAADERFDVWDQLSDFFLDTELDHHDYERIGATLAKSHYSIVKLEEILDFEVAPACKWNLLSIAGEWSGFHPDWIVKYIAPRKNVRPRWTFGSTYRSFTRSPHWRPVKKLIIEKRDAVQ